MPAMQARPMYTGTIARPGGHAAGRPGFRAGCGHPRASCCCDCRECRKDAKEVLVEPTASRDQLAKDSQHGETFARMAAFANVGAAAAEGRSGIGTAFIGGGCCVHLSVEFTPTAGADGSITILVRDSNNTALGWAKQVSAGDGYQIKEGVVTTMPGARLSVVAVNVTARVRWCEVFSCC